MKFNELQRIIVKEYRILDEEKYEPSTYRDMLSVWLDVMKRKTNSSREPHDIDMFNALNKGEIKKPSSASEWEEISKVFSNFSQFALFMMLHRHPSLGDNWATPLDSFKLIGTLLDSFNPRLARSSITMGLLAAPSKLGRDCYKGNDPFYSMFLKGCANGTLANTIFTRSQLLIFSAYSEKDSETCIMNLIPGLMTKYITAEDLGFPELDSVTTKGAITQFKTALNTSNEKIIAALREDFVEEPKPEAPTSAPAKPDYWIEL